MTGEVVRTVLGDVSPQGLGITLFHEHLSSDMTPWLADEDLRLTDRAIVARDLDDAARDGVTCVVDASTSDVGRRALDLRWIARASEILVVAGGGLYRELTYPKDIGRIREEELVAMFIGEATEGIGDSDVRAGVFGEIGSSRGGMTVNERKVFGAIAEAHNRTGVPILTHTDTDPRAALEQLDTLMSLGVAAEHVAIGHLDCIGDPAIHAEVAARGSYVGFDRVGLDWCQSDARRADFVLALCEQGHADRVLLSSDIARRSRLRGAGGQGYGGIVRRFVPLLRSLGVELQTIRTLLVDNPKRFLSFMPIQAD